jgi:hypothetical protein
MIFGTGRNHVWEIGEIVDLLVADLIVPSSPGGPSRLGLAIDGTDDARPSGAPVDVRSVIGT